MNDQSDRAEVIIADESEKSYNRTFLSLKKYVNSRSYAFSNKMADYFEESKKNIHTDEMGGGETHITLRAARGYYGDLVCIEFNLSSTVSRKIDALPTNLETRIAVHDNMHSEHDTDEKNEENKDDLELNNGSQLENEDGENGIYIYETIEYAVSELEKTMTVTSTTAYIIDGEVKFVTSTDEEESYNFEDYCRDDNEQYLFEINNHESDVHTLLFTEDQITSMERIDEEMITHKAIGKRVMNIIAILDGKALFI